MDFARTMKRYTHGATLAAGVLALLLGSGCETTDVTSLEGSRGAWQEAHEYLRIGRTTQEAARRHFGEPHRAEPLGDGAVWRYWRTETVIVNAYTGTPLGTDGAILAGQGGFQHTVLRRVRMDLLFDARGVLRDYRIERHAP